MTRILLAVLALAVWLSPVQAADQPAAEKPEAETALGVTDSQIRLGTWAPLSGDAAPWGAMARGMDVYFQWLNRKGGINGRGLKLLMFDDRYDPAVTEAGVLKLTKEYGVFAFVGGVGARSGLA
ncbi:MAG: ABC transporter substrate-binding protein, partial [Pseudomonadota bacterium]